MTDEIKQEYIHRITRANRTRLIVILFDIFEVYAAEAEVGYVDGKKGDAASRSSLRQASEALSHLKKDLDFSQDEELCSRLDSIYTYCRELIARAMYCGSYEPVAEARKLIAPIRESFEKLAEGDDSEPLMQNVPEKVAGYTYGKRDVNEAEVEYDSNRGFFV